MININKHVNIYCNAIKVQNRSDRYFIVPLLPLSIFLVNSHASQVIFILLLFLLSPRRKLR